MDNTKKVNRWLSQILRCYEQTNAIVAQMEEEQGSAAFMAHCQERLEFFAIREQVLKKRMRRLERRLLHEVAEAKKGAAEANKRLLDTIYEAARKHGKVVLTKTDDGDVEIKIPSAEKK